MTKKVLLLTVVFLALAAGALVAARSTFDPTICPVGAMKFTGGIYFGTSPSGRIDLYMSEVRVWKGSAPAPGGAMTLMGRRARSDGNRYILTIDRMTVAAGDPVIMTFQPPWAGLPLYTGTVAAPSFVRFTSPANEALIRVGGAGSLLIAWNGGNPPYVLNIADRSTHLSVFSLRGIAGGRVTVPFATFAPAKRYHVTVTDSGRKFAFDRAVDPATDLYLNQMSSLFFNTN